MGFDNVNVNASGPVQPTSTYKTKVLKGNHSFASQITEPNMKYVIKHDFVLDGDVTIPANSVLEFDGGSVSGNKTLTGTNTGINAGNVSIFGNNIDIAGSWLVPDIYSNWFVDVTQNNILKKVLKLTSGDIHNNIYIADGTYQLSALTDTRETVLMLDNPDTDVYCSGSLNLAPNGFYGYNIVTISADNVKWHGGSIIGDAKDHDYSTHQGDGYGTHEWGFGIALTGSNCTIEDVNISLCTGDGICVKGDSVSNIIIGTTISKCRRQGITVANTKNLIVSDFVISNIGSFTYEGVLVAGTDPQAAFDIEPDSNTNAAEEIIIQNGIIDSCKVGIQGYRLENITQNNNITIKNIYCNNTTYFILSYSMKNVVIENVELNTVGDNANVVSFNEETNIIVKNIKGASHFGLLNGSLELSGSIIGNLKVDGGNVICNNCQISSINTSTTTKKSLILNNCIVSIENGTLLNFNASGYFKLFAKSTKFEKLTETGSVGAFFIGGNIDFEFDDCEFYLKNGLTTFTQLSDVSLTKISLKDCINYTWNNDAFIEDMTKVSNFDKVYVSYTEKDYLVGSTRPTLSAFSAGHKFFDTSLSPAKPIYWTGSAWVDATGTPV